LTKTQLIYSVSCFILGAWSFVWGAKPPEAPVGDGTASMQYKIREDCLS